MREQETAMITSIKSDIRWKVWEEQIREQTYSGLTAKEWCRQNNINIKTCCLALGRSSPWANTFIRIFGALSEV